MRNDLQAAVRYFEMRCEGKTDFEALAMCDRREMERTALSAIRDALQRQPDPDTGLKGCWHCRNIEAHHIEYVIAVKAKGGTPMNMPVDCPYHYCPACGRKLEAYD